MGPHHRKAKQNAESNGVDDSKRGGPGVIGVQQAEENADYGHGDPGAVAADQILQGEAAEGNLFAGSAAEQEQGSEDRRADGNVGARERAIRGQVCPQSRDGHDAGTRCRQTDAGQKIVQPTRRPAEPDVLKGSRLEDGKRERRGDARRQ